MNNIVKLKEIIILIYAGRLQSPAAVFALYGRWQDPYCGDFSVTGAVDAFGRRIQIIEKINTARNSMLKYQGK